MSSKTPYEQAMKILNGQSKRDWELESAARQVRTAPTNWARYHAEHNLKDVLARRYKVA